MKSPLIGITTYRTTNQYGNPILALGENYVQSISRSGGLPMLIPLGLPEDQLNLLVSRLDGILFSGGGDIHPDIFGMESTPEVNNVDPDRDRVEIQLVRKVVSNEVPFLGICRGIQVINVALGGTLHTHILDQHPRALKHDFYPDWPRDHLAHSVRIENNTQLAEILATTEIETNSLHHQGICSLSAKLTATAWSPDGLIEAIEFPNYPFGMAVQWHPEWMPESAPMRALFGAFIESAAQ